MALENISDLEDPKYIDAVTIMQLMQEMELSIEEIDTLTGTVSGRPKSATFRTADVVGLDTMIKVADNLYKDCPEDERRDVHEYRVPLRHPGPPAAGAVVPELWRPHPPCG